MAEGRPEQLNLTKLRELAKEREPHSITGFRKQELARKLATLPHARVQQAVAELPGSLHDAADGGMLVSGLLEIVSEDDFGFLCLASCLPGEEDAYVSPSQIRRFRLKTGDLVTDVKHLRGEEGRHNTLPYVNMTNGARVTELRRANSKDMTPIFPDKRTPLATGDKSSLMLRVVDLTALAGKGQRDLIVTPPRAGRMTLLKEIAKTVRENAPGIHLIVPLIDGRPEEVTDIRKYTADPEVGVIYSTLDRESEQHRRIFEMAIGRAHRIIKQHGDVMILPDSITRLACAYNLTVTSSEYTLSNDLDPVSLYVPEHFFNAMWNMWEGSSLTILTTAFVGTGSRMDDMIYKEFKGTGNMGLILNRRLAERHVFPAIDMTWSETRREELLLSATEREGVVGLRNLRGSRADEVQTEAFLRLLWGSADNHALLGRLADSKQKLFLDLQRQREHAILRKPSFNESGDEKAVRRFHQYQARAR